MHAGLLCTPAVPEIDTRFCREASRRFPSNAYSSFQFQPEESASPYTKLSVRTSVRKEDFCPRPSPKPAGHPRLAVGRLPQHSNIPKKHLSDEDISARLDLKAPEWPRPRGRTPLLGLWIGGVPICDLFGVNKTPTKVVNLGRDLWFSIVSLGCVPSREGPYTDTT